MALAIAIAFSTSTSGAVQPPISDADLEKKADTIVEGESSFVVCNGVTSEGKLRMQQYVASVKPYKWYKGAHVDLLSVAGAVPIDPLPPGSIPMPALPRGWRGKLYLMKAKNNVYALVAYNAAVEDKQRSTPSELPRCSVGSGADEDAGTSEAGSTSASASASALKTAELVPPAAESGSQPQAKTAPSRGCSGCGAARSSRADLGPIALFGLGALAGFRRRRTSIRAHTI